MSGSRRLAALYLVMHAVAATVVAALALPAPWRVLGVLVILGHCGWIVRGAALRRDRRAIVRLHFQGEEACVAKCRDGTSVSGSVDGSSHILPGLIVLRLARPGGRRKLAIVLLPDAVAPDAFRRLRVRLRWGRLTPPPGIADRWL